MLGVLLMASTVRRLHVRNADKPGLIRVSALLARLKTPKRTLVQ